MDDITCIPAYISSAASWILMGFFFWYVWFLGVLALFWYCSDDTMNICLCPFPLCSLFPACGIIFVLLSISIKDYREIFTVCLAVFGEVVNLAGLLTAGTSVPHPVHKGGHPCRFSSIGPLYLSGVALGGPRPDLWGGFQRVFEIADVHQCSWSAWCRPTLQEQLVVLASVRTCEGMAWSRRSDAPSGGRAPYLDLATACFCSAAARRTTHRQPSPLS